MSKKIKTIKLMSGGAAPIEFQTKVKTWGEFKKEIQNDFNLPSPHSAILGETMAVLIDETVLPELVEFKGETKSEFHIYVTPKKSKSGGEDFSEVSYKDCKSRIKILRTENDKAKKFFGDYTHMTTKDLRKVLTKWFKKNNKKSKKIKEEKVTKPVTKKTTKKKVAEKKSKSVTEGKVVFPLVKSEPKDYDKIKKLIQ